MAEYLFNVGDKVKIKYFTDTADNYTYKITHRQQLLDGDQTDANSVNVYVMESVGIKPIQERYIDEVYLEYERNYLRQQKLKFLENVYK